MAQSSRPATRPPSIFSQDGLGMLSAMLLAGLAASALSLAVVTVLPALAAASAHVRRHVDAESDSLGELWSDFVSAAKTGWIWSVGIAVVTGLIIADVTWLTSGVVPGGRALLVMTVMASAIFAAFVTRSAAAWRPGTSWPSVIRQSWRDMKDDLVGTGMLLVAVGLCAMAVWMLFALSILVPGMLSLAGVGVDRRWTRVSAT